MKEKLEVLKTFLLFIIELIKKYPNLNDDIENNRLVCKDISQNLLKITNINLKVLNKENIPEEDRILVASNHQSFFDVFLLIAALDKALPFAAAKELYKYPFLGNFISSIGCIPIDRYTEDITKLKEQVNNIYQHLMKDSLILFPEGECSYEKNQIQEFKKGGFMKINLTDATVIPTYIHLSQFNNIGRWYIPTNDVIVSFGQGFKPSDISDKKVSAKQLALYTQEQVLALKRNID